MKSALNRGKAVEQFLGGDGETIQWISLRLDDEGVQVTHFHVEDPSDPEYLDVYNFALVDEGNYDGTMTEFPSLEAALAFCAEKYGTRADRFVNEFVVQDEYSDFLKNRNT